MTTKHLPPPELLRKMLRYQPEDGFLFWRERPANLFSDGGLGADVNMRRWNTKWADKGALMSINPHGYLSGAIFNKLFLAHRVIWAIGTGVWPTDQIDHLNHDRADNRWVNLREVTHQENGKNQKMNKNNTSGFQGVYWSASNGKWLAYINVDGYRKHLGCFTNKSNAIAVRKDANIKYGFHHNHGEEVL